MNESAIKDLHYEWYLKILSKLHELLGECNMKEFLNITSCVNPWQTNCDQVRDYNLLLRYNKIPLNAIDLSTRLWGNKSHKLCSYFLEPCTEVFCFGQNFNIRASKLVYCWSLHTIAHLLQDWTGKITKARALICSAVQIKSYW